MLERIIALIIPEKTARFADFFPWLKPTRRTGNILKYAKRSPKPGPITAVEERRELTRPAPILIIVLLSIYKCISMNSYLRQLSLFYSV